MAYTQAQINAALAVEIGKNPSLSQATLVEAGKSLGLSDAQINAAFDTIPGFNAQGQYDAADYIANRVPGTVDPQAVVDAANAARAIEQAANEKFSRENQIQHSVIDEETGQRVQLNPYHPDFNPNNQTTLAMLGQKVLSGDTGASNFFLMNPQYRPLADAAWAKEKARLNEIDRINALKTGTQPTGLLTGQAERDALTQTMASADRGTQEKAQASPNPSAVPKGFIEGLTAIPNVTDRQIVAAMKTANVSPKNLADALGISEGEVVARVAGTVPNGQTVQLGDTIVQPKYRVTGSGETEEIGPIENVYSYRVSDNKVGGGYTQYKPDGTVERTGTQVKVNATKDFVKFALTAGALFGGAALAGLGPSVQAVGLTAAEAAGLGLTATEAASLGFTGTQLAAAGYTAADITAAGLSSTSATGLLTGTADVVATNVVADAATGLTASQLATAARLGLTATQFAALLSSGGQTVAGLLQQETSREAAVKAQSMIDTETAAAKKSAAFRPVGMTTRFGTSEFVTDPVTGQLTSAKYTATPGVLEAQNRLVALGNQGLAQAEAAQGQFAPLQAGATSLFNLGSKYLAQSPEAVAENYLKSQMSLLQPGRELELANLQNKLQQQGRGGLAVAQGGTLGDTTPELQALYNARATQEAQLAANAQQYGQQQVGFGAGLLSQGAQTMGQYYGGQQAAYAPFTTALGQFTNLEQLAQQPLGLSAGLAQQSATAGANVARFGLLGAGQSVDLATGRAATTNPYATALGGLTSNPLLTDALARSLGYSNQAGSLTAGLTPAQIAAAEAGYPTDFSFVP
jgi:hypothetical protein